MKNVEHLHDYCLLWILYFTWSDGYAISSFLGEKLSVVVSGLSGVLVFNFLIGVYPGRLDGLMHGATRVWRKGRIIHRRVFFLFTHTVFRPGSVRGLVLGA